MIAAPTPAEIFMQALQRGYKPSDRELCDLCTELHAATVDGPLFDFLGTSFEEMGDVVYKAMQDSTPLDLEDAREYPCAGERGELDAAAIYAESQA